MTKLTSDYFTVVDAAPLPPAASAPAFAAGEAYRVHEQGGGYRLTYLSGEHQGREKSLDISEEQARGLRDGSTTLDAVLIAHGAS